MRLCLLSHTAPRWLRQVYHLTQQTEEPNAFLFSLANSCGLLRFFFSRPFLVKVVVIAVFVVISHNSINFLNWEVKEKSLICLFCCWTHCLIYKQSLWSRKYYFSKQDLSYGLSQLPTGLFPFASRLHIQYSNAFFPLASYLWSQSTDSKALTQGPAQAHLEVLQSSKIQNVLISDFENSGE